MADFLSRLVEQTLGLVPVAQPVITSMFAPRPAQAGTDAVGAISEETVNAEPEHISHPNFEPPADSTRSGTIFLPAEHHTSKDYPVIERIPTEHTAHERVESINAYHTEYGAHEGGEPIISHRISERDVPDIFTTVQPLIHPSSVSFPLRNNDSIPLQFELAGSSNVDQERLPRNQVSSLLTTGPQQPLRKQIQDTLERTLPETSSPRSLAVSEIRRQAQFSIQRERTKLQEHVSAAPVEPTVQVSIGRIDVRAVLSPATTAQRQDSPPQPRPALSLDDYLKQQRGGAR